MYVFVLILLAKYNFKIFKRSLFSYQEIRLDTHPATTDPAGA